MISHYFTARLLFTDYSLPSAAGLCLIRVVRSPSLDPTRSKRFHLLLLTHDSGLQEQRVASLFC
jgi:hypothetical protein